MKCEKCGQSEEWWWRLEGCNERGWECGGCGEKPGEEPGYCPQLDEEEIAGKVRQILLDLHEAKVLYVSNGTVGDGVAAGVAERCRGTGYYDQSTIASWLLEACNGGTHAEFWKKLGDGIRVGEDPRKRCHCGALAKAFSNGTARCWEHLSPFGAEQTGGES